MGLDGFRTSAMECGRLLLKGKWKCYWLLDPGSYLLATQINVT